MQVVAYKDKKGNVYETEDQQIKADALIDLGEAVKNDEDFYYGRLNIHNGTELKDFLERHRDLILKVL